MEITAFCIEAKGIESAQMNLKLVIAIPLVANNLAGCDIS